MIHSHIILNILVLRYQGVDAFRENHNLDFANILTASIYG